MNKRQKRVKEFKKNTTLTISIGVMFLFAGLYRLFFNQAKIGSHYLTTEITINDGSVLVLVGLILSLIGIYRILKKDKLLKQIEEIEKM